MSDGMVCNWLMEHAGLPIRYRVARDFLKESQLTAELEKQLLDDPLILKWLVKLQMLTGTSNREGNDNQAGECNSKKETVLLRGINTEHGAADFYLENALPKLTQLGMCYEMPVMKEALQFYLDRLSNYEDYDSYFGRAENTEIQYRTGRNFPAILTANFMAAAGCQEPVVMDFLLGSLEEMYRFVQDDPKHFYLTEEERVKLKGIPAPWKDKEFFIYPKVLQKYQFSYPFIYDLVGLYRLYELEDEEVDRKIDAVISYISTDAFHLKYTDGYGILVEENKGYHAMGWDPKYPGWFSLPNTEDVTGCRLLSYGLFISKYHGVKESDWYRKFLDCLSQYRTEDGRYCFPKEWLKEQSSCAVLGYHMSFGENRRKKDWCEIESTFYMQLLEECVD